MHVYLHAIVGSPNLQVDAALDTTNVERLASYIKAQKSAQYIVVTHRPEVPSNTRSFDGFHWDPADMSLPLSGILSVCMLK